MEIIKLLLISLRAIFQHLISASFLGLIVLSCERLVGKRSSSWQNERGVFLGESTACNAHWRSRGVTVNHDL